MTHDLGGNKTDLLQLSAGEQAGMRDFWEVYDSHYDEVQSELMIIVNRLPQFAAIISRLNPATIEEQSRRSRELMRRAVLEGEWAALHADQRDQGSRYASMGVPFTEWFDLVSAFQRVLVPHLTERHAKDATRLANVMVAMNLYTDFAMSAIGDEYLRTKERIISQQAADILELSTPVLQIRSRLLLVPLVGVVDTTRARLLTEQLLRAIRNHRAKVVVIDITGVPAVDSKVANHLFQTVAAAKLMGARAVITGLSAEVAQALVVLGVDVDRLNTLGDLQEGLEEAERILGFEVKVISKENEAPGPG